MILQALTEYYETMESRGEIAPPGWDQVQASPMLLCIQEDGTLEQVIPLLESQPEDSKLRPQSIELPAPVKKSSGITSNFLWENSSYILGIDNKGKPQRAQDCFAACRLLHEQLLTDVDSPAARAVLAFFQRWQPEQAAEHPALADCLEELLSGVNLLFRVNGAYVHEDPLVRKAWDAHYQADNNAPSMICLVTGKKGPGGEYSPFH